MKFVLVISLLCALSTQVLQVGGVTKCMTGVKMTSTFIPPDAMPTPAETVCGPRMSCSVVTATTTGIEMEIGNCLPSSICRKMTCKAIKQQMAQIPNIPATIRDSLQCTAKCCKNGRCKTIQTSSPPSPSLMTFPASSCNETMVPTGCDAHCVKTCANIIRPPICDRRCVPGCTCPENTYLREGRCVTADQCPSCPDTMVFSQCDANCVKTCANVDRPLICTLECAPGCACPDNTYLHEGRCVAADQCPSNSCPDTMVFSQCGANCVKTCANVDRPLVCTLECAPGCACPDSTYLHEGRCVAADQCPNNSCPDTMVFSQCGANCVKTCANVDRPLVCTLECAPGCACPDNTYLHEGRCVAADQCPIGGVTRCMTGVEVTSVFFPADAMPSPTETVCSSDMSCSVVTATTTGFEMEFGSCVPASVCPNINCEMIKQRMAREARLPATIRDSLNCSAKCCRNGKCTTTPSSPSLPTCSIPMWNVQMEDNFFNIGRKPKPKFKLIVKSPKKGFKGGKSYKVFITAMTSKPTNTRPLIQRFFITLNASGCSCVEAPEPCPAGRFVSSRLRIAGAPTVEVNCSEPLISNFDGGSFKKSPVASWTAPGDCHDGVIEMRAAVVGTNGKMYVDNDEEETKYLTKILRPMPKKAKKNKKKNRKH